MRMYRFFASLLAALLLLLAATSGALAHAGLIAADPAEGSVLATQPAAVTLTFTEPVTPIGLSLIGVGGTPQALEVKQPDGPVVEGVLPAGLAQGSYLLSWRVTSADGHPVSGTLDFAIGAPSGTVTDVAETSPFGPAIWLVRTAQYLALFLGVGSLAFGTIAALPMAIARYARGLSAVGLVLVPVALALQGLDLLGAPVEAVLTANPWTAALASPYAWTEGAFAIAFVLALVPLRWIAVPAALIGALAPLLSGHVVTASPQLLMRVVLFVHIASLIFWLGALLPLAAQLRRNDTTGLARFSRFIPIPIVALIVSGLTLALVQLGPPEADWLSPYGLLLAAKLALVVVLLGLAWWNRTRLTARAAAGDTGPLRRSIVAELVLVVAILGIVAGWRFTPPPRVLAEIAAAQAPLHVALSGDGATGALDISPGRIGQVALDLDIGGPAKTVTVHLSNPDQQIAAITRPAEASGDRWHVASMPLPTDGDWQVAVDIRVDDFTLRKLTGSFALPTAGDAMKHPALTAIVASSMLATPAVAGPGVLDSCAAGQTFAIGAITATGAFMRATPPAAKSAGAYLVLNNSGAEPDTLTGAASPAAGDIGLHSMAMNGDVMEMGPVEGGIAIPAGGSVALAPMGYHMMLTGLTQRFAEGQCVEMVLHFAKAGDLPIELNVGGMAADGPPMAHDMASMEGM